MKNKILYAEDDYDIRKMFSSFLKTFFPEQNIEIFEDGISLDKRLIENVEDISLAITDYDMPGINGGDIIARHSDKGIPFILAYWGEERIGKKALLEDGAFTYVRKPFRLAEFKNCIYRILDSY